MRHTLASVLCNTWVQNGRELLKLAVTSVPGIRPETTMQRLLTVTLNRRPEDRVAGDFNGLL